MKWINLLIIPVVISSCSKVEFRTPEIEVKVETIEHKVGEPVFFDIKSNADNIVFYSGVGYGDTLNEYKYRNGRVIDVEELKMSFNSRVLAGSQTNQLQVLVSTDFNGIYTLEEAEKATWTDITSHFDFATNTTTVNSGEYVLNGHLEAGKPIYVCFKYNVRPRTTHLSSRDWTVSDFLISNEGNLGKHNVVTFAQSGFAAETAALKGNIVRPSVFNNTQITFRGNNTSATWDENTEVWAISKPINTDVLVLGSDKSIPLKGYKDLRHEAFYYTYNRPGYYTVTFEAFTFNESEKVAVTKQMYIVVKP